MPHVVLDTQIDLKKFAEKFESIINKDDMLIKVENIFVDKHNRSALLPTVVIDEEKQNFFIEILANIEKTTVRLFPLTDPIKTKGVKTALALTAFQLMKFYPNSKISKTNIDEFLQR